MSFLEHTSTCLNIANWHFAYGMIYSWSKFPLWHTCRTPNCFCGTWHLMRLLSHYVILQVPHRHLAVGVRLHIGTTLAFQQVFSSLLQECEMFRSSHPLLLTEYMPIPSLVWCSLMNQSSPSVARASSKSGPDRTRVKTTSNQILLNSF